MSKKIIYTTYFGKLNHDPSLLKKVTPVAICAKPPVNWQGKQYPALAPKYAFFMKYKDDGDFNAFSKAYNEQVLKDLDPKVIGNRLMLMADVATDVALVCYEKDQNVCHRNLVAAWLRKAGYEVEELV